MNAKKRRRIAFVIALFVASAAGAAFVIMALGKNVRYFYSPSDIAAEHVAPGTPIRIGGLVQAKSVQHDSGIEVHFVITDGNHIVPVAYTGGLPGLFREGQGSWHLGRSIRMGSLMQPNCWPNTMNVMNPRRSLTR